MTFEVGTLNVRNDYTTASRTTQQEMPGEINVRLNFIYPAIVALLLGGCAVVERYDARGALTERRIGVMPVAVAPTHDAPAVRVRAAGALYMGGSAILGYGDLTIIKPQRDCSAFIFVDDADEARRWADLAADVNGLCKGADQ